MKKALISDNYIFDRLSAAIPAPHNVKIGRSNAEFTEFEIYQDGMHFYRALTVYAEDRDMELEEFYYKVLEPFMIKYLRKWSSLPSVKPVLAVQHGGVHYKKLTIQPVEYIHANGIGYFEGSAIKYLSRWKDKGGIEDLKKAVHFIEFLIEFETNKK